MPLKPVVWMGQTRCEAQVAVTDVLRIDKKQPIRNPAARRRVIMNRANALLQQTRGERLEALRESTSRQAQHQEECVANRSVASSLPAPSSTLHLSSTPPRPLGGDVHRIETCGSSVMFDFEGSPSVDLSRALAMCSKTSTDDTAAVRQLVTAEDFAPTPLTPPAEAVSIATSPPSFVAGAPQMDTDEEHIMLSPSVSATTPVESIRGGALEGTRRPSDWHFDDDQTGGTETTSIQITQESESHTQSPIFHSTDQ